MNIRSFITEKYGRVHYHHARTDSPSVEKFERHCHNGFELIYVVRGDGKYIVEGTEYPLCPNTVLLLRPYEYHYVCPASDCPYERYVIHFSEDLLIDAAQTLSIVQTPTASGTGVYFPKEEVSLLIRSQFETLDLDLMSDGDKASAIPSRAETILRTTVNQILIFLSFLQSNTPKATENEWVADVMRYLNENLAQEITLEETARHFFVSKYHLCHTFREHTGVSVFSYLNTKRIALAEQLLEDGITAADVAFRVGFRDYSVFYRAYKKITGESPSRTKRKMQDEKG